MHRPESGGIPVCFGACRCAGWTNERDQSPGQNLYFEGTKNWIWAARKTLAWKWQTQISTTDPDVSALLVQGQVVEVSFNIQAAVDDKHNLVVATHTINRNDRIALAAIAKEVQENLDIENYTALVDKGCHNGRQIQECSDAKISTIVASPAFVNSNEKGTTKAYMVNEFIYN